MNKRNTSKEKKKDRKGYPYKTGGKNRTKKITLLLFTMLSMVLLVAPMISSELLTFDNTLSYENNDLKVTITNTFGLGRELGTLELKSHSSVEQVLEFGFGAEEVVMYYDFSGWELYKDGLGIVTFTNMTSGKEIQKDYEFVEWKEIDIVVNDYKETCSLSLNGTNECSQDIVGTHIEKKFDWVTLTNKDITNKRIGIRTYVGQGDYIDAVLTIAGKEIKRHASWTAGLDVGLKGFYSFDTSSGTNVVENVSGIFNLTMSGGIGRISGKIGNALNLTGIDGKAINTDGSYFANGTDYTINLWVRNTRAIQTFATILATRSSGGQGWAVTTDAQTTNFRFLSANEILHDFPNFVDNTWHFYSITREGTNYTFYFDSIVDGTVINAVVDDPNPTLRIGKNEGAGDRDLIGTSIDLVSFYNRSLSPTEIITHYNSGDGLNYEIIIDDNPVVTLNTPINTSNFTTNSINFGGVVTDNFNLINVSRILNNEYIETNTSGINNSNYTFTEILADGDYVWTYEACDNSSQCINGTARSFSIDTIFPTINISSPNETSYNYLVYGNNFTLNTTINDTNLDTCWYDYNSTNTTFPCSSGVLTSQNLTITNYTTIIIYANDSVGHLSYDSFSWTYNLFDFNDYAYEENITELTPTTFSGEFQTGSSLSSSYLEYNNTNNSISINSLGGNRYILTSSLTTPSVSSNTNITWFFWVNNVNATAYNQTVVNINLDNCDSYTFYLVNYTLVEELTQENIVNENSTIESLVIIKTIVGGEVAKFNETFNGTATASICSEFNLNTSSLRLWEQSRYGSTDHVFEQHNIQNASMTSLPNEITLRDLISTSATTFRIQYKSATFLPVVNAVINIQRKYIGEGIFKEIESPLTDSSGESSASLDLNSVLYRIIVSKNGEILATFENPAVACDNILTGDCTITINERDSATLINNYDIINNFNYGLSQDNRTITLSFSIPNGENRLVNLFVNQSTILGNKTSCNQTLFATSGQIQCDIAEGLGDVYLIVDVSADSILIRKATTTILEDRSQYFGTDNIVLTFFLVLSLVLLMVSSPITVLIGLVIGLIASSLMLLLNSGDLFGVAPVLTYLIIIVILLIVKISGRENR